MSMRNLGSPADAALIDEVMVVAVDGREGAGTARVSRPAQSRASSCEVRTQNRPST